MTYSAQSLEHTLLATSAYTDLVLGKGGPATARRFLTHLATALGAEHAAVARVTGSRNRGVQTLVHTLSIDQDAARATALAAPRIGVALRCRSITSAHDDGKVIVLATRPVDAPPFGQSELALLQMVLASCEPALIVAPPPAPTDEDALTDKQQRIVNLVVAGAEARSIAEETGTSLQNVKNQIRRIYEKLGVSNRTELSNWYHGRSSPVHPA